MQKLFERLEFDTSDAVRSPISVVVVGNKSGKPPAHNKCADSAPTLIDADACRLEAK